MWVELRFGEVVGRVDEDEVERALRGVEVGDRGGAMHRDRGIPPQGFRDARGIALDDGCRARCLLDEVGARRAPADRLERERTRSGVEIEDRGAAQRIGGLEGAEQSDSRTRSLVGRVPASGTSRVSEPARPAMMRVTWPP